MEESIKRFNTQSQARYFVESRGQSFDDYVAEYDNYQHARDAVLKCIPGDVRFQVIDRTMLPNFLFGPGDLALTLGQDGLVVNAAKYLEGQPVLALNPDPDRFDGVLLPFLWSEAAHRIEQALDGELEKKYITMARADLNDGQHLYAFNDFFIGASSHISARYTLQFDEKKERQSSSGIIVSTPAGSTGWLSSLYNMATGIQTFRGAKSDFAGKSKLSATSKGPSGIHSGRVKGAGSAQEPMQWDERRLVFVVREPFRSNWSGADLVAGELDEDGALSIESHMPEGGVIFSDGMLEDFLQFNSGATATIKIAEKKTSLLVSP
ncbi:MAG: NAD+ kinase [Leptospiraceae bacterium]|nr:NAD+ kinase [Leptospiraceae bacterium]